MSGLVLVGGPAGPNLALLGRELSARDDVQRIDFGFAPFLQRLREATQHRATVWQGVGARPADWIDPALRRLADATAQALTPGARWSVDARVDNACELELLGGALPHARFVLLVRDGRFAPAAVDTPQAALDWAREWARACGPIVRSAQSVGARAHVVRDEELVADPSRAMASIVQSLGLETACEWTGPAPQRCEPLSPALLECFAAHGPARALSEQLGYALAAPGPECDSSPEVALELVRALLSEGRVDEARARASRALALQACAATHEALGLVELRSGRETQAVHSLLRAVQADVNRVGPWRELFALAHRPELLAVAEFARLSTQPQVRYALARWLVARGLDREAAEIVANVAHQPWQSV